MWGRKGGLGGGGGGGGGGWHKELMARQLDRESEGDGGEKECGTWTVSLSIKGPQHSGNATTSPLLL